MSHVNRAFRGLVWSNTYISLTAAGMALTTMVLAELPLVGLPLFIAFSTFFFIYNLDRYTDREEDKTNVPQRAAFFERYGRFLLPASAILYLIGLSLAYSRNPLSFAFALSPGILSVIYSIAGAKSILFGKNIIVGLGWGTVPLMVGAYFSGLGVRVALLFLYFTVVWFINTIVFDVKDIEGDRRGGGPDGSERLRAWVR